MYTRSDDPKQIPHKNLIALAVILIIGALLTFLVSNLWSLAQINSKLGDKDIQKALTNQTISSEDLALQAEERELTATGDSVTTILFAITSTSGDTSGQLSGIKLAVLNETQNFAKLLDISPEASVTISESAHTLAQFYAEDGVSALAQGISYTGAVPVSHAIVISDAGWEAFMGAATQGTSTLRSQASDLLKSIEQSDMDLTDLIDTVTRATDAGLSASNIETIETSEVEDDEGNIYYELNGNQIALAAGTLTE